MTLHPLLNNLLNITFLRRALIGTVLGLIIISILSFTNSNGKKEHIQPTIAFDTAIINLPDIKSTDLSHDHAETSDDATINVTQNNDDDNAKRYKYFARHKGKMTSIQADAFKNDTPRLSLILSNIGQQESQTQLILDKLPKSVTLAMSPNTRLHNNITMQFNEFGFETWLDLATLTLSTNHDWGASALSPSYNFARNIELLSMQMDDKDNVTGVILPNNSLLTESPQLWADITQDLFADGYAVLDNTASIIKPSLFFFNNNRAPYIKGDIQLPDIISHDELNDILKIIRKQTLEQKNMIVTVPFSTPATLDILAEWLNSLEVDGITLVPLSAQAKL